MKARNFATLTGKELTSELSTKYNDFLDHRRSYLEPRWNVNRQTFYNHNLMDTTGSGGIDYTGKQGEIINLGVNHTRNLIVNTMNLIIGTKPSFNVKAVNSDAKSLEQARLANNILEFLSKEKNLDEVLKRAIEEALIHDAGYVSVTWDAGAGNVFALDENGMNVNEGDVMYRNLDAYSVIVDPHKREFKDNDWVMTYAMRSRWDLAAQFPDLEDDILAVKTGDTDKAQADSDYMTNDLGESEDVQVFEFYHKRSSSLPEGKYVMFVGDVILYEGDLPYRDLPVYQIVASRNLTSQFGYSVINDLVPLQKRLNATYSAIASNHDAFAVQKIVVPRGANISPAELTSNLTAIYYDETEAGPPQGLSLVNTPSEVFAMCDRIIKDMETISGVNAVVRGTSPSGTTSGAALALLQNQSISYMSSTQESYVKLVSDVGTATIRLMRDFAQAPRLISILGKNAGGMESFTGDDLTNVDRVVAELGNPMARTAAGRVELATQMIQSGFIRNPDEYLMVMETGNLDVLTEGSIKPLQFIREENEALMKGQPVNAIITDNHRQHILEHVSILNNLEMRQDEALLNNVLAHIQQHINMLQDPVIANLHMLLGSQPLQAPQMNQMPAQAPGPIQQPVQPGVNPGGQPQNMPNMPGQPGAAIQR